MFKHSLIKNANRFGARTLVAMLGLVLLQGCAANGSSHGQNSSTINARQTKTSVTPLDYDQSQGFNKLNDIRRAKFLPPFQTDSRLQKAAQDYANLMGSRGLYGHEIGPGTDFKSRIFAVGYNNSAGENIGVGYSSIEKALAGWMNSSGHRKNMLKRNYSVAGLAYGFNTSGKNPRYTHYWVLIMGKADSRL